MASSDRAAAAATRGCATRRLLALALALGAALGRAASSEDAAASENDWERAEAALLAGDAQGAAAIAKGSKDPDAAALGRYVAQRKPDPKDRERFRAVVQSRDMRAGQSAGAARSIAVSARGGGDTVTESTAFDAEAEAIVAVAGEGAPPLEASQAFSESARVAESIGWRVRAAHERYRALQSAFAAGDPARGASEGERAFLLLSGLGDEENAAASLIDTASCLASIRDWAHAIDLYRRAIERLERRERWYEVAQARSSLGSVYRRVGAYARSLDTLDRALDDLKRAKEATPGDEATILDRQASVRQELGQIEVAVGLHTRARDLHQKDLAAATARSDLNAARVARLFAAGAISNRGLARLRIDEARNTPEDVAAEAAKAQPDLEAALVEMEAIHDDDGIATAMSNLAEALSRLGKPERALVLQRGANEKWRGLPSHEVDAAIGEGYLGDHLRAARQDREAVEAYRGAREQAVRVLAKKAVVDDDLGIARCLLRLRDGAGALAAARSARKGLADLVRGLGDQEAAGARESRIGIFDAGVRAALLVKDPAAVAEFLEASRAGTLLEALGSGDALRASVLPRDLAEAEKAARDGIFVARSELQGAVQRGVSAPDRHRLTKDVVAAEDGLTRVEERVRREAKDAANVAYPEPSTLDEIRATLAPDEAFVEFAAVDNDWCALVVTPRRTDVLDGSHAPAKEGAAPPSGSGPAGVPPAAAAPPLPSVAKVTALVESIEFDSAGSTWKEPFESLRDLLWKPLGLDNATRRVFLSPDGPLCFLPLALLDPSREIVLVPSGTVLKQLRDADAARGKLAPRSERGFLAVGGVDYKAPRPLHALELYGAGESLPDLPQSAAEASSVGTVLLVGPDASEARLRAELANVPLPAKAPRPRPTELAGADSGSRWAALHVACHGHLERDRPLLTCLVLTPSGDDDGFLTVGEILGLRVPADLVYLSACRVGGGRHYLADGVLGMTHAFMAAGAPRVIVSLWNVEDTAGRTFSEAFYRAWKAGDSTASALRHAQAAVAGAKPQWKDPYYWAGWTLWGLAD